MTNATPKRPRRRWPLILIAVVVAALIGYTIYALAQRNDDGTEGTPTSSPTASTAAPIAKVTGCLGGPSRDADMVLAAQAAAPNSVEGAAEMAAAMVRWSYQYPYPSDADAGTVSEAAVSAEAPASFRDLASFFAKDPNLSGGIVPDATQYRLSTVGGVWHVESSEEGKASITIGAAFVVKDELSSELRASVTVGLVWEDGAWHVTQLSGERTTEELFQIGTLFAGGC